MIPIEISETLVNRVETEIGESNLSVDEFITGAVELRLSVENDSELIPNND